MAVLGEVAKVALGAIIVILVVIIAVVAAMYFVAKSTVCRLPLIGPMLCKSCVGHPDAKVDPNGDCYVCPTDMTRTAAPVTSRTACAGYGLGAPNDKQGVQYCEHTYGSHSFPDDTEGGTCWTCPSGMDRAILPPVTADNACVLPGGEAACAKMGEGVFGDPTTGDCWRCPAGWIRTGNPVTDDDACSAGFTVLSKKTIDYCKKIAGPTAYPDPNGDCYACPSGMQQSGADSHSRTACTVAPVWEGGALSKKAKDWCERLGGDHAFADPNGYCYACPSGWNRTIFAATGDTACIKQGTFADYGPATKHGAWTAPATKHGTWVLPADKVGPWTDSATRNGGMSAPAVIYSQ